MNDSMINADPINTDHTNADLLASDRFDDFLRQQLHSDYIDDNGFTAHLMASMPAQKKLNPWLEKLIIGLPVALISLLVASQLPWRDVVRQAYAWALTVDMTNLASLAAALLALAIAIPLYLVFAKSPLL